MQTGQKRYMNNLILAADWLIDNLVDNSFGIPVWMHHFNFEYQKGLTAPWYSGLAQGQGLSLLLRAYHTTQNEEYLRTAESAFLSFQTPVQEGGVIIRDKDEYLWIEEYIVNPPSHVLNGFIWALWGVYDYYLVTGSDRAKNIFEDAVETLHANLERYDIGYWSLYDLSSLKLKMIASPFYHQLHIVQLTIMHELTGKEVFRKYKDRWESYQKRNLNRVRAFAYKLVFKALYF
jgi:hypothetical protein